MLEEGDDLMLLLFVIKKHITSIFYDFCSNSYMYLKPKNQKIKITKSIKGDNQPISIIDCMKVLPNTRRNP
jgi:hypothetical protein